MNLLDRLTNYKRTLGKMNKLFTLKKYSPRGPFLVSRYGALECSKRDDKEYYYRFIALKRC